MSNNEKAKATIRALLNLANDDGAADAEIENALRLARREMLKHNLTEEDVAEEKARTPEEIAADTEYAQRDGYATGANLAAWEGQLGMVIADLVGTVGVYRNHAQARRTSHGTLVMDANGRTKRQARMTFYGPAEDVRDASELFEEWAEIIQAMAMMKFGGSKRGEGRSYAEGFVVGMRSKVQKIVREERKLIEERTDGTKALPGVHPGAATTALVLVKQHSLIAAKKTHGEEWLRESEGIKLRKGSGGGGGRHHGNAFGEGKTDGAKANISHSRTKKITG